MTIKQSTERHQYDFAGSQVVYVDGWEKYAEIVETLDLACVGEEVCVRFFGEAYAWCWVNDVKPIGPVAHELLRIDR